ncbi:mechanosensitive ion channel family protein [Sinorhizobium meliloti]|uniref:mechanosensitive ion channel family protein n=1 Tax=Rhizobium meliloti TaxID=382 RepID=UPI000FDA7EB4|nr:mechanosensitive ion channel family protein [Sinorhizobium meliloti]
MTSTRFLLRRTSATGPTFERALDQGRSVSALLRLLLVAFLLTFAPPALAQDSGGQPEAGAAADVQGQSSALPEVPPKAFPEEQARIDAWQATLERVEAALQAERIDDVTLSQLRSQIAKIPMQAAGLKAALQPRLQLVNQRIEQLKPADEQAARNQTEAIKSEQAQLQSEAAGLQGVVQQADLIALRAQQDIDTIGERRRALFTSSILQRSQSLADPSFWFDLAAATPETLADQSRVVGHWFGALVERTGRSAAGILVVVIGFAAFLLSPGRRWLTRRTSRDPSVLHPSGLAKATAAAAITLANLLIPAVAFFVLYQAMSILKVLPADLATVLRPVLFGLTFASFFYGLSIAVLAPERPSWRLVHVTDTAAERLIPIIVAMAVVNVGGLALDAFLKATHAPLSFAVAAQGLGAIALGILAMFALRFVAREDDDENPQGTSSAWRLLIPVTWAVAALTVIAPLAGFVAFGRFAALQIVFTTAVLMSLVLLLRLADEAISYGFSVQTRIGGFMRQAIGLKPNTISQIGVILAGFARLIVIMVAVMALLAPWGIQSEDVVGTFTSAFFGFEIAGFSFSPSAILGAIVVFVVVIVATRGFQRWLDGRLLPQTSLDTGLRTSIHTGVGYVGAAIAGLVAFSYAGLNLQNVAIVASALSVGIGFGLQSIVNNFVSGIILLAERPFKVGDRIEVGPNTGIVQRVSVRATQIQTFDNVTVIVPNADLISGQVVNWMHGDFSARLKIPVGVSYESDPEQVRRVLLEIAMDNPRVLKIPEPFVSFTDFGADALQFTLFCHVGNINADAGAASDMRFEIAKRFREEKIEMPFGQRDIHLRDLASIEGLVRELFDGRTAAPAAASRPGQTRAKRRKSAAEAASE